MRLCVGPPLPRLPPTKKLQATSLVDAVSTADHEPDDGGDSEAILVCECIEDVFFVNQKHTSKNDVHAMLESAGFSRSNPYYILEQGKVKNLALMTDAKRLGLFKEVAGTNVYEEKRLDAQKKLAEAKSAQLLINEEYASLTKKLEQLEEEKSEEGKN